MIIKKINIISFGGLKNYSLDLSQGFNCIYGENEQGKTTVMSFIKMMFYGSDRGSTQISKSIRKKYTPWDGSAMSGSIEFQINGKDYRLEREFRSSNSTDKVYLTDLALGEKTPCEADIGVKLFGLTASAFERSIFIGQLGFPESNSDAESEINAKLSNLISTADERVSLEEVCSRLEKPRFALISKSGKAGAYYKNQILANELADKLRESKIANSQYSENKKKLITHINETKELTKKAVLLKARLDKETDIKNARKLAEFIELKERLEEVKAQLTLSDGSPADESYLRKVRFSLSKLNDLKLKVKAKETEWEIIKNQLDTLIDGPKLQLDEAPEKLDSDLKALNNNLTETQSSINEARQKTELLRNKNYGKKSGQKPIVLGIGGMIIIIAAFLLLYFPIIAVILGGLGIITSVLGLIIYLISYLSESKKEKCYKSEILSLEDFIDSKTRLADALKSEISHKRSKLEAISLANSSNSQVIEAQRSKLNLCQNELAVLKDEEQLLSDEFESVLGQLIKNADSIDATIELLENATQSQKDLKGQIGFLLRDLNNITYEEAKKKLSELDSIKSDNTDFSTLKTEFEALQNEIIQRRRSEDIAATELKALISGVENPDSIEKRLSELTDSLTSQKRFCDSADIALQTLAESFAELRKNYGSKLEKLSSEYFTALTEGKYSNITVSKSFSLNIEQPNSLSREAEYLSNGAFDQAYLSVRLAVAELISPKEGLPLFLDDALAQYDDKRAKIALKLLRDYTKDSQAIMFTCHKSIFDLSKELNCIAKSL